MAYGSRGKLKENLEGIHRNCDWVTIHCQQSLELIKDVNPKLKKSFELLHKMAKQIDDFSSAIYKTI